MPTTTNYGWTTPADTDLVKDGAAAIRTLGSSADTTVKNLNPETTLGDIAYRSSTSNVNTRLAIGSTGQVLTVAGGVPSWATPASGGMTLLDTMTLSGSSVTSTTFSSAYNQILIYIKGVYLGAENDFHLRLNGDTGSNYQYQYFLTGIGTNYSAVNSASFIRLGVLGSQSATLKNYYGLVTITRPSDTDVVHIQSKSVYSDATRPYQENVTAVYDNSAAITSVTLFPAGSTFSAGSAFIYGVK